MSAFARMNKEDQDQLLASMPHPIAATMDKSPAANAGSLESDDVVLGRQGAPDQVGVW